MKSTAPISVVDIFAGAGGLGEGFDAYLRGKSRSGPFQVSLSVDMDHHAVQTLRTRAFFRSFAADEVPQSYYEYVADRRNGPWTGATEKIWRRAEAQSCELRLGDKDDDRVLDERIAQVAKDARRRHQPWVLVGGPPCQAFSLVGRARNSGNSSYVPENDERHTLYEHYLPILSKHRPAVFVLENVKGLLSAKLGGEGIFAEVFQRLERPGGPRGPRYRIEPIVQRNQAAGKWDPKSFIVRSELLGIPQNRHRVVLVGVLEEVGRSIRPLVESAPKATLGDMILGLPEIRSCPTDENVDSWSKFASRRLAECARLARHIDAETAKHLHTLSSLAGAGAELGVGARWSPGKNKERLPRHLDGFVRDPRLHGVLQHQARRHMTSDLLRYGYAAAFTHVNGRSPKGSDEFPDKLHPQHKSWGKKRHFADRFKVQRADAPSSTITSHLAKDGHYFIHPDPLQLRSLTVREAARLQTFPDNYFFEGPLGAQRRQVGNAVPPWLGHQIAKVIHEVLS